MSKQTKPTIVFCHGIWADGSCFSKVIPTLQSDGNEAIALQYGLADGRVSYEFTPDAHDVRRRPRISASGARQPLLGWICWRSSAWRRSSGQLGHALETKVPDSPIPSDTCSSIPTAHDGRIHCPTNLA
jgi:hypothetical protein